MLRSSALWQIGVLPFRAVVWIVALCSLIVVIACQTVLSVASRRRRLGGRSLRLPILLFREGVVGDRFDKRFAPFHPAMNAERFWQIYVRRRPFEATIDELFVCAPGQIVVSHLGQFDPDEPIDPELLDAPAEDFVVAPTPEVTVSRKLFSLVITNQGGFGFGIRSGDKLIFEDTRDTIPDDADVVLSDRAIVQQVGTNQAPGRFLGILVGAVGPNGEASQLSLPGRQGR